MKKKTQSQLEYEEFRSHIKCNTDYLFDYGIYKDVPIGDIPMDYLRQEVENNPDININVIEYVSGKECSERKYFPKCKTY